MDEPPQFHDGVPVITGSFTGWRPKKMLNLFEYIQEHDLHKPDFKELAARDGKIRP